MAKPPFRVGVAYDFRNPPESGMTHAAFYAAIIEQAAWLDDLGLDVAWFTEHHFVEDGYLPSWIPIAGAIAARTKRLRFSSDVCLMPFNHPIRLAEALAVLTRAFTGETFSFEGQRYSFRDVKITPGYVQPGGPPLWIAAMGRPGAERAAHHGANLLPQGLRSETLDHWSTALKAAGGDPATRRVGIIR